MVWSSNCSTVARIAHAVIIARWGTSWWSVSPGILAASSPSVASGARMRTRGGQRQTRHQRCDGIAIACLVHGAVAATATLAARGSSIEIADPRALASPNAAPWVRQTEQRMNVGQPERAAGSLALPGARHAPARSGRYQVVTPPEQS